MVAEGDNQTQRITYLSVILDVSKSFRLAVFVRDKSNVLHLAML